MITSGHKCLKKQWEKSSVTELFWISVVIVWWRGKKYSFTHVMFEDLKKVLHPCLKCFPKFLIWMASYKLPTISPRYHQFMQVVAFNHWINNFFKSCKIKITTNNSDLTAIKMFILLYVKIILYQALP